MQFNQGSITGMMQHHARTWEPGRGEQEEQTGGSRLPLPLQESLKLTPPSGSPHQDGSAKGTEVAHQAHPHCAPAPARSTLGCVSEAPEGLASPRGDAAVQVGASDPTCRTTPGDVDAAVL